MQKTNATISLDRVVKSEAQYLAKTLGLTFSSIIEYQLRQFIKEQGMLFEARHPLVHKGDSNKVVEERFNAIRRERAKRIWNSDSAMRKYGKIR